MNYIETSLSHSSREAWIYSSQGGQLPGMCRRLFSDEAVFRDIIRACNQEIYTHLKWSLIEEMNRDDRHYRLDKSTYFIQPAVTSLQLALSSLLLAHRKPPDAVAGLSMGEVAAAYIAGMITLKDAMRIVCCQAELSTRELPPGSMAFVFLPPDQVRRYLAEFEYKIWVAVELDPEVTIISGEASVLSTVISRLVGQGIHCGQIPLGFAYHTPLVEVLQDDFRKRLQYLQPGPGAIEMYSSVSGSRLDGRELTVDYWWQIMRQPAYFFAMIQQMLRQGYRAFVEIGPQTMLTNSISHIAQGSRTPVAVNDVTCQGLDERAVLEDLIRHTLKGGEL